MLMKCFRYNKAPRQQLQHIEVKGHIQGKQMQPIKPMNRDLETVQTLKSA